MNAALKFRVTGDVQGVGFRYATQNKANELELTGWVKNCRDGAVEGAAQGNREALATFTSWLWQGPSYACVNKVETWEETESTQKGFRILR